MEIVQVLAFGLLLGGVYALLASGVTLIFGVLDVVNVAQGAFLVFSALFTWQIWDAFGVEPLLLIPVMGFLMGVLGWGIYRGMVMRVAPQGPGMTVLLMFGVALTLEGILNLIFGNKFKSVTPPYFTESFTIGQLVIPLPQLISGVLGFLILGGIYAYLRLSWAGRALRASAQNKDGAALVGISSVKSASFAFAIGAATAGVGGVLLSIMYPIYPATQYDWIARLLGIVVLGGFGSIPGAVIGSLILGMTEAFANTYLPQWSSLFFYGTILLILLFRPHGLMGAKTREDVA
ncbi:MAG: branched-chain amino acid ABC transporter permease [Actinomycetales bacterium]|nr:branched-chain amino acid ABC transporter permease [Actinomycetales bacterium]